MSKYDYRPAWSARSGAWLPLLLSLACTGEITGDPQGGSALGPSGGPGTPGVPGIPGAPSVPGAPGSPAAPGAPVGPIVSAPGASSRFSRLNHKQWENTVRDLLRLPAAAGLSTSFVAEPLRSAFDTNGAILTVAPDLWSDYQTAAEALARKVARDPQLLAGLVTGLPGDAAGKARAFVTGFGLRAFRRPLTEAETTRYLALFGKGATLVAGGDAFADGVELALSAFLQSPNFLYRTETQHPGGQRPGAPRRLRIASRLSYGLLNSMPDDALLAAAGARQLQARDGLLDQARRLHRDPRRQAEHPGLSRPAPAPARARGGQEGRAPVAPVPPGRRR